jgi:hypothetical protein
MVKSASHLGGTLHTLQKRFVEKVFAILLSHTRKQDFHFEQVIMILLLQSA